MTGNRLLFYVLFLLTLPLLVAWWDITVGCTLFIIALTLLWRWGISLSALLKPVPVPELQLDTISASHFVEKVRWCMDIMDIEYTERAAGGTLGIFFTGRTVPQLRIHTGATRSSIGNSPDILRYLWGRYSAISPEKTQFLTPTPERLALEAKIDRYGVNLQVWGYYHLLENKALSLHLWGRNCPQLPAWQRYAVLTLFPILRFLIRKAFRISTRSFARATEKIEAFLLDVEQNLENDQLSILGNNVESTSYNYTDISFAAISGLWLLPEGYGGGKADGVELKHAVLPPAMLNDIERWIQTYPKAVALIEHLYQQRGKSQ
ncbi:hypothetical protein A9Q99_08920 [Gammaproteobacteria bacterium 45_16_T64]|nr:hypothetical protein A9Q99_08920 [Gammaproteobacteria bacterium 45_16_T64]